MRLLKLRLSYSSGWKGPICEIYAPTGEASPLHDAERARTRPIGLFYVYDSEWRIGRWSALIHVVLISRVFLLWNPNGWWSAGLFVLLVALSSLNCLVFPRTVLFTAPFIEYIIIKGPNTRLKDISDVPLDDRKACVGITKVRRSLCHGGAMLLTGLALLFIIWIYPGKNDRQMSIAMQHPVSKPINKNHVDTLKANAVIFFEDLGGEIESWNEVRRGAALATLRTQDDLKILATATPDIGFEPPKGQKLAGLLMRPSLGDKFSIPELGTRFPNAIVYAGAKSDLDAFRKSSRKDTFIFTIVAAVLLAAAISQMRRMKTWLSATSKQLGVRK